MSALGEDMAMSCRGARWYQTVSGVVLETNLQMMLLWLLFNYLFNLANVDFCWEKKKKKEINLCLFFLITVICAAVMRHFES